MKILIIAAIIAALGIYLYFIRHNRKYLNDNQGRRSGTDRRKSFIASKTEYKDPTKNADKLRTDAKNYAMYESAVPIL